MLDQLRVVLDLPVACSNDIGLLLQEMHGLAEVDRSQHKVFELSELLFGELPETLLFLALVKEKLFNDQSSHNLIGVVNFI